MGIAVFVALLAGFAAPADQGPGCQRVILPPRGEANERTKQIVAEAVARGVASDARCRVLSPADVRALLDIEATRQECGVDEASCLVELGEALGADEVIAIDLQRMRDGFVLDVRRLSPKNAAVLSRADARATFDGASLADAGEAVGRDAVAAAGTSTSVLPNVLLAAGATSAVAGGLALVGAGVAWGWAVATLSTPAASSLDKERALGAGAWLPLGALAGAGAGALGAGLLIAGVVLE